MAENLRRFISKQNHYLWQPIFILGHTKAATFTTTQKTTESRIFSARDLCFAIGSNLVSYRHAGFSSSAQNRSLNRGVNQEAV